MDNLTILFGIFSRALQKKVHKSLKFSRGSFWTSGQMKLFKIPYFREYKTIFFFPSPWVPTYTIDTTYLSFFLKKLGKNSRFLSKIMKKI